MTEQSVVRILLVDDFEPFREFVRSKIQIQPHLVVVCEVSDGLEAVHQAHELQPGLIVLDIGLPSLDGMEAAKQIRTVSPDSKILFVSQESSPTVVQEAFRLGASGYVVKSDGFEISNAINAVLRGERFVSKSLMGYDIPEASTN